MCSEKERAGECGKRDVICITALCCAITYNVAQQNINANCTVNMICESMKVSDDGTSPLFSRKSRPRFLIFKAIFSAVPASNPNIQYTKLITKTCSTI